MQEMEGGDIPSQSTSASNNRKRKLSRGEYLEPVTTILETSDFDLQRQFRPLKDEGQRGTIDVRTINTDLTCRVCLGIIRNCYTVMECLHRFCSECIEKSLRLGQKQCPSCRTPCPSRRSLRQDHMFNKVIAGIYPDIKKAEQQQDQLVQQIINSQNHRAFARSMEEGENRQRALSKRGTFISKPKPKPKPPSPPKSVKTNTPPRNSSHVHTPSLNIVPLSPKPPAEGITVCLQELQSTSSLPNFPLQKSFIRTSRILTIEQLHKYLLLKLRPPSPTQFEIFLRTNTSVTKLSGTMSLDKVEKTLWKRTDALTLCYAVQV